jgi:small-conductance mechanosensitive channel
MAFVRAKFRSFGSSSLDFELVFDSLADDYDTLLDNTQKLQFAIYREFTKQKIAFAFPTQTVHLKK